MSLAGSKVIPIVLAAGASQRMGVHKALLEYGGCSALECIHSTCSRAGLGAPTVVVGHQAGQVAPAALHIGYRVARNPKPERGQTTSLQVAVAALPGWAEAFLVWPVDLPLVTAGTLRALMANAEAAEIVLPICKGRRGHPVLFIAALAGEILQLQAETPLHQVVRREPGRLREVAVNDLHVLDRINTPRGYRRVAAALI